VSTSSAIDDLLTPLRTAQGLPLNCTAPQVSGLASTALNKSSRLPPFWHSSAADESAFEALCPAGLTCDYPEIQVGGPEI
jgi:hypothetical protein